MAQVTIEIMRKYVSEAYPGKEWRNKVNKMSDKQVSAIYTRMINTKR